MTQTQDKQTRIRKTNKATNEKSKIILRHSSGNLLSALDNIKLFYLSGWAGIRSTIYRTETFVHESTIQSAEY